MHRSAILTALALSATAAADPCEAPLPKAGATFAGPVTYIVDGDGLCVGELDGGIEVRLGDFNAPELREPGGAEAKAVLAGLVENRTIECIAGHKSFDRVVASCRIDGRTIGDLMRGKGIAEGGR